MLVALACTAALIAAAPRTPSKDSGAADDQSDLEFRKAFGAVHATRAPAAVERPSTVYVPPPLVAAVEPTLERLQPKDVKAVVLSASSDISRCVEVQHNRQPGKTGQLVVQWSIGINGKVSKVKLVSEELKGTYIASCMTPVVKRLVFPKHTVVGDPVVFPFKF